MERITVGIYLILAACFAVVALVSKERSHAVANVVFAVACVIAAVIQRKYGR